MAEIQTYTVMWMDMLCARAVGYYLYVTKVVHHRLCGGCIFNPLVQLIGACPISCCKTLILSIMPIGCEICHRLDLYEKVS